MIKKNGAEGRTRTDTGSPLPDFESSASTNFTTPAYLKECDCIIKYYKFKKIIIINDFNIFSLWL